MAAFDRVKRASGLFEWMDCLECGLDGPVVDQVGQAFEVSVAFACQERREGLVGEVSQRRGGFADGTAKREPLVRIESREGFA